MRGLPGIAAAMLSQSERRVEIAAENVANMSTPGYKRRVGFSELLPQGGRQSVAEPSSSSFTDMSVGKIVETGNPGDLAIGGSGYLVLQDDHGIAYARTGQFARTADGRLVTAQGLVLQSADGGDVVLRDGAFAVDPDGTVTQAGAPVARLALVEFAPDAVLSARAGGFAAAGAEPTPAAGAAVRQGALEASNVSTGEEMVAMMEALRRAEGAQRLVNVYDELMGRMLTTLGQN